MDQSIHIKEVVKNMEEIKIMAEENNNTQLETTNKYFYIELLASLFITTFVVFGTYYYFVGSREIYKCGILDVCLDDRRPYLYIIASWLANAVFLTLSKLYFRIEFFQKIKNVCFSFIIIIIYPSLILVFNVYTPPNLYIEIVTFIIIIPICLSIYIDRKTIKNILLEKNTSDQIKALKQLFRITVIILFMWTISLTILLKTNIGNVITNYIFMN